MSGMCGVTRGSCNCGAVRWQVDGPLREIIACHCSQCRKQTGLYYAATSAADKDLTIEGDGLQWYEASDFARRGFCSICGSALFWKRNGGDKTSILAGSIDGETDLRIAEHIFVAEKPEWYEITDDLAQS